MTLYARVFLAFIRGLIDVDQRADAFLFHTSLMNVSDALRDNDSLRAVNRLSMMAQGFGGGTRIGHCLHQFNSQYASRIIGRRSVVIIMSDGYDTGDSHITLCSSASASTSQAGSASASEAVRPSCSASASGATRKMQPPSRRSARRYSG